MEIQDLNGERFLTHSRESFVHKILAGVYLKNDIYVQLVSEADDDISLMAMVSAGMGLAVLTYTPTFLFQDTKAIPILGSNYTGGFLVGRLQGTPLPDLAQSFFEFLTSAQWPSLLSRYKEGRKQVREERGIELRERCKKEAIQKGSDRDEKRFRRERETDEGALQMRKSYRRERITDGKER